MTIQPSSIDSSQMKIREVMQAQYARWLEQHRAAAPVQGSDLTADLLKMQDLAFTETQAPTAARSPFYTRRITENGFHYLMRVWFA